MTESRIISGPMSGTAARWGRGNWRSSGGSSVKRLSSWLEDIITITTMDPEIVTFTGTMGKGYTSTPMPEAPVDYHMDAPIYAGGAFGTITQTAIPAAI